LLRGGDEQQNIKEGRKEANQGFLRVEDRRDSYISPRPTRIDFREYDWSRKDPEERRQEL